MTTRIITSDDLAETTADALCDIYEIALRLAGLTDDSDVVDLSIAVNLLLHATAYVMAMLPEAGSRGAVRKITAGYAKDLTRLIVSARKEQRESGLEAAIIPVTFQ